MAAAVFSAAQPWPWANQICYYGNTVLAPGPDP